MSNRLLRCAVLCAVLITPALARADMALEVHGGTLPMRTVPFAGTYVYDDGFDQYPLDLRVPGMNRAVDVGFLLYWPAFFSGDLTIGPVFGGDILFGGLHGLRAVGGVRAELDLGMFAPFVGGTVGFLHAWRSMGRVSGRDLLAPDGSLVPVGRSIDASVNSLGFDAEVGAALKFGDWALVGAASWGHYTFLGNLRATSTNYADESVRLGELNDVPGPGYGGLGFRLGVRRVFGF